VVYELEPGNKEDAVKRTVRVLLADDEEHVRKLLSVICTSLEGVQVVGEAGDGEVAVHQFKQLLPDVVLLDINMPKLTGTEVLKRIKEIDPSVYVVMLTSLNSIEVVRECIANGAKNYILKSNQPEKIRSSIKEICFEKLRKLAGS
jgi:two-component system chemotaxis response regulator CheY